jgi:hypothetical protein
VCCRQTGSYSSRYWVGTVSTGDKSRFLSLRGMTGQKRKNCVSAEKLSSPLNRPFFPKLLIPMEI